MGESFWTDGYFAERVGKVEEEVVKKYICQQRGNPWSEYATGLKSRALAWGVFITN